MWGGVLFVLGWGDVPRSLLSVYIKCGELKLGEGGRGRRRIREGGGRRRKEGRREGGGGG